ncbi:formate dehydrogenase accessory sulfurtransferase FdhD [Sphingobium sp.]|uniref:formate dehydrogenase accessory sulfurtransferase FdhD n=1 Tax=Sphingobium sp. TaxID=1912891 RepID=UPI003B3AF986
MALDDPPSSITPQRSFALTRVAADGAMTAIHRVIAEEVPVALEYQGIGYAVLMATPSDLIDLAYGFTLSERIIDRADQIDGVDVHQTSNGFIVRVSLDMAVADRILDRIRHRTTDSSCGLCGIESLEQALRPLPPVTNAPLAEYAACFRALSELDQRQSMNRQTGAMHAAAACTTSGHIRIIREDIGRHNAFDKLIGSMLRSSMKWDGGFALISSRCSYELVEKAVIAGCPMLATISAPTGLAIDRAASSGLKLRALVRSDALLSFDM